MFIRSWPTGTGLAVAIVLALTACGRSPSVDPAGGVPAPASDLASAAPVAVSADCRSAVARTVAQRLGADPARMRTQLRTDPNTTLMNLAKPAGLAQDQLAVLILTALNDCADTALRSGTWTAQQASEEKRFWSGQPQPALIAEVGRWFGEG